MATSFLSTGPRESELLKALMARDNRQTSNPQSGQEAALRTVSGLVDAVTQKKIFDDERELAKTARTADMAALRAYSSGQAASPEQYIERGTADPLEKYLAPISLDPQVFGTDAPAIDNYSQNVMPQDPTAQDLMGGTHVMPDGTTMLNSDMTGAMPETPQNVIPQAPTADQLMGDPMGMALGGEPLPQELTPEQAVQQQMVEGVGQGFDYNPAQGGVEGFSQEALQLALQNGEISPQMANNLVSMQASERARSIGNTSGAQNFRFYQSIIEDPNSTDEEVQAAKVAQGIQARAGRDQVQMIGKVPHRFDPNTGEMVPVQVQGQDVTATSVALNEGIIEEKIAGSKARGKGMTERMNLQITEGLDAAKGIPILRRGLSLLESVETGGFANAALLARQYFGVEGADEGELSANLGVAVLSKLRETFGAAFTAKEGEELKNLSASFGRSAATNKQLLRQALLLAQGAMNRARNAATELGDEYTLNQLRLYDEGAYDLTDERLQSVFNPTQLDNDGGNLDYYNPETKSLQKKPYKPTER